MKSVKGMGWRLSSMPIGISEEERQRRKVIKDFLAKDWVTSFPNNDVWDRTYRGHYDFSTYKK